MFTEEDLEALVPDKVFARGAAYYYEDDAVGRIQRKGNVFKTRVQGTSTYRVVLTVQAAGPPEISCDCPYEHGEVCKHGIALGLAVLDLLGEENSTKIVKSPATKPNKKEQRQHVLTRAWARTSDKEKLAFLKQLLSQKPKQLRRFLAAFEFDKKLLLAAATPPLPQPPASRPRRKPVPTPRRGLTLAEKTYQLLAAHKGKEVLPLLLSVDWREEPPLWDTHLLPHLLLQAAKFQPEATLDAAMERFELWVETPALRAPAVYSRLASCLKALATLPALAEQTKLFASELMQQYPRLQQLRQNLGWAGFARIVPEGQALPKRRGRKPKNDPL